MFGTIARATLKPGQEGKLETFLQEWERDIRPKIPRPFITMMRHQAGQPDRIVFLALAQDEQTYRTLASMLEQDQFYRRVNEVFTAEPAWEDVEMAWGLRE